MEPSTIKINENSIDKLLRYGLDCNTEYKTRLQNRKENDINKIVYILNPLHNPMDRNSNQFVALTEVEYKIVN